MYQYAEVPEHEIDPDLLRLAWRCVRLAAADLGTAAPAIRWFEEETPAARRTRILRSREPALEWPAKLAGLSRFSADAPEIWLSVDHHSARSLTSLGQVLELVDTIFHECRHQKQQASWGPGTGVSPLEFKESGMTEYDATIYARAWREWLVRGDVASPPLWRAS